MKELHYFSRSKNHPSPSHLAVQGTLRKFFGRANEARAWRRLAFTRAPKWLMREDSTNRMSCLIWIFRYFFGKPSDDWYRGLFRQGAGRIKGELTPAYSLLGERDVAHVAHLFPDLKIILLMRDPLDRVLSQTRYHMDGKAHPRLHEASEDQLVQFATETGQIRRGDYIRIVDIWRKFFPARNMHLVFFEDIVNRPEQVWAGILKFLGAEGSAPPDQNVLSQKRNTANPRHFSYRAIRSIARAHENIIRQCADRFGGHSLNWANRLDIILKEKL